MMAETKQALLIDAFQAGGEALVILKGRLMLENCDTARQRISEVLTESVETLYIYLGRLEFIDSAGWGAMVGLKTIANRNHSRLVFLSPTPRVREIFKISKLDAIFEILEGSDAETVRANLVKRENIVFRDSQDENQAAYVTEGGHTPEEPGGGLQGVRAPAIAGAGIKNDRQRELDLLARDALEHLRNGAYQRAVDLYKKIIEIEPEDLSALNNLGVVYEKKPEWYGEAMEIWKRVFELSKSRNDLKHVDRARRHIEYLERML